MYKILFNKKSAELEQMLKSKFVKCKNERGRSSKNIKQMEALVIKSGNID